MRSTFVLCVIVSLVIGFCETANAQTRGTRAAAMGGAGVATPSDTWTGVSNPAGLAEVKNYRVSAILLPELFGMKELQTIGVGGVIPLGPIGVGVNVFQFGFELYKETGVSASVGGEIDWDITGGLTIHANRYSFDRYGSTTKILVDGGFQANPVKDLRLGFTARNITGTTIGSQGERLPRSFSFGTSYSPIQSFLITVELEKDVRYPLSLKAGIEQRFLDILSLRLGTSSQPSMFSGGLGITYSMFEFGYAGFSHPDLGWSHQVEVGIVLGK